MRFDIDSIKSFPHTGESYRITVLLPRESSSGAEHRLLCTTTDFTSWALSLLFSLIIAWESSILSERRMHLHSHTIELDGHWGQAAAASTPSVFSRRICLYAYGNVSNAKHAASRSR
jgi:hypothetical protein